MTKAKQRLLVIGLLLLVAGVIFSSYRNCNRGCQSVAQHLVDHGLQDIALALM